MWSSSLTEPTENSLPAIAPPPGYGILDDHLLASSNNPAILEQLQCPICLRILHQPMELPCRALCMVEWFKVFSCSEVKCPCCFTDTPLTAAPQLIQTLLTDMVLECQTCRKDIRGVEYITHQCSGEPTKAEVRTLFGLTNALHNLVNWRVGHILIDAPGREQHDVELVNVCGEYVTRLLRDLVARCSVRFGCVTCTSHLADPSFPCRTVQKTFRLLQHNAVNVTTTSLKECRSIASHFPTSCISVLHTSVYPTSLKWMFPGLSTYLRQQNVTTPSLAAPWCTLVQFREAFHHAMELGHLYTVATREDDEPGPSTRHASTSVL
ncbi:hypothetical protein EMCRGX_G027044 [Ephydatia muelleri]